MARREYPEASMYKMNLLGSCQQAAPPFTTWIQSVNTVKAIQNETPIIKGTIIIFYPNHGGGGLEHTAPYPLGRLLNLISS